MDRRLWTPEEDQHIIRLVAKFGTKKWPLISERLCAETEFERTGKQCRQRWYNHLSPDISSAEWSQEDEERLFEAHKEHGNKWKIISRLFQGRTDNSIKNHFYSTIRRCLRRINKLQGEKNSTLKMRSIKPFVLSKILADKNLTETILELGKIKPNKSRRDYKIQYFEEFNEMITKLYRINSQYQLHKSHKKHLFQEKVKASSEQAQDSLSPEEEDREPEDWSSPKHENRGLNIVMKQYDEDKGRSMKKNSSRKQSPKKQIPLKKKNSKGKAQQKLQLQEFKLIKLNEGCSRRSRKTINYMKLNEGILCQNQRHQGQEASQDVEVIRKRIDFMKTEENISLEEKLFGNEGLSDIMEVEEKQNQKEYLDHVQNLERQNQSVQMSYNHRNLLSHEEIEFKGNRHYEVANPSPCYHKNASFFDDLVIIGTQLKILATPRAPSQNLGSNDRINSFEILQNDQNFIEDVMEINFDPEFVMNYASEDKMGPEQ